MAAEFVDGVTRICQDWLNPVSKTVFDALGAAETPEQALENIGGIDQAYVDAADAGLQSQISALSLAAGLLYLDTAYLYVDPAGDAEPTSPLSGNPFDSLESLFAWLNPRYLVRALSIEFAAGSYTESASLEIPQTIDLCTLIGPGPGSATIDWGGQYFTSVARTLSIEASGLTFVSDGGGTKFTVEGGFIIETGATFAIESTAPSSSSPVLLLNGPSAISSGATLDIDGGNASAHALRTKGVYFVNGGTVDTTGLAKNVVVGNTSGYVPLSTGTWSSGADVVWDGASPEATTGYFNNPRTGIITQFGFVTAGTGTSGSVTFPLAFPVACYNVQTTSTVNTAPVSAASYLTTGFTWGKSSTSANFAWMALGR